MLHLPWRGIYNVGVSTLNKLREGLEMGEKEKELYRRWCEYKIEDADVVRDLWFTENDENGISDRFYTDIEFGTAGLRGVMGAGINRMNIYVVRRATQGVAGWLLSRAGKPEVAIGYDSRNKSRLFASEAARVFAANGIKVHIFSSLRPVPMVSYAVRKLGCAAGVMVTASHNPAEYNGYKVYGDDGCQIGPETAREVFTRIRATDVLDGALLCDYDEAVGSGMIEYIPESFDEKYLRRVLRERVNPGLPELGKLSVVYTPLNGAGNVPVRRMLKLCGAENVAVVPEQEAPNGDFPTCPYPNPEIKEALALGLRLAAERGADILLATDPDCDRVGVASRDGDGYRILTGNEVGALLLDYIAKCRIDNGTMPERPVAVKSIVSTKLADAVAAEYGVEMRNVMTGFRYIGGVIDELDKAGGERFILGFEESCGYLSGGYVRDKDGVDASMLVCEMAAYYKRRGMTLADALAALHQRFGYFADSQMNFYCEGETGLKRIKDTMERLRAQPPKEIAGQAVTKVVDYLPEGNALEYVLANGASAIVRPSGTEPKVKAYLSVRAKDEAAAREFEGKLRADVSAVMGF